MRTGIANQIEQKEGRPFTEIVTDLYEKHGSQTAVASDLGISQSRLSQLLKEYGLREKRILVKESA